jgi:acyl-CoA reductase-like NAD-dependent aldehyde dehydrogenase
MSAVETALPLLIGGEWRQTGSVLASRDPSRPERVVGSVAVASVADVRDAFAAARAAADGWRRTPGPVRGEILFRAAEILAGRAGELAEELSREEGKTLREARAELARGVAVLRFHAGEASRQGGGVHPSATPDRLLYSVREPLGVVGVITPWNFPIAIPLWKIAPALAHGNAVVFKPSEVTPLGGYRVAEVLTEAGLPPGVLNVVCGDPTEIGGAVSGDPELDGLSFTGSLRVGDLLRQRAATSRTKLQLELGGKNPVIVLDDADLDQAVAETIKGAMHASGQKCTATSRVLVTPGIADAFVERLLQAAGALRVGDPLDPASDLGPLVNGAQHARVNDYLAVAADEGHQLALGGPREHGVGDGWFVTPTVYLDVPPDSRIGQEEIFGPVVAVMPADDLDAALTIANDVEFGLSASVFTRDIERAWRFIREIRAGVVHVNSETTGAEPQVPFGGVKASSAGYREQGEAAAEFFTQVKTVYVDPPRSA